MRSRIPLNGIALRQGCGLPWLPGSGFGGRCRLCCGMDWLRSLMLGCGFLAGRGRGGDGSLAMRARAGGGGQGIGDYDAVVAVLAMEVALLRRLGEI